MAQITQSTDPKTAPFRADIVGSFLRPQSLKQARADFEQGKLSSEALHAAEDAAIRELVAKEKAIGLSGVTDGEFRRSWWHLDFMWGLDGVEKAPIAKGYRFHDETTRAETAVLSGKIRFGTHPFLEHFRFLQSVTGNDALARQCIPAPAQFLSELQRDANWAVTQAVYPTMEELVEDIARAYQDAIQAFYALGCRNLQLDDCTWGMFCDRAYWELRMKHGVDVAEIAQLYLHINNAALEGRPADMAITTHVCRGNYHSTWATSGGYEPIAELLFGSENVDAYYLEYDTERAGSFEPLRFVSDGKKVVLGLLSSKVGTLEDKAEVVERIREASQFVPLDRLYLSPQCGFASTEEGNVLTEKEQWAKLQYVKEIANEVWG